MASQASRDPRDRDLSICRGVLARRVVAHHRACDIPVTTGPKTSRLVTLLDELAVILRELDQAHWADSMSESARRLRQNDFSGIHHLLSAYGGMGSFNDILPELVGELPDHRVERARQLRSQAWDLGDEIRRESEID